jgi:hypothetical protein
MDSWPENRNLVNYTVKESDLSAANDRETFISGASGQELSPIGSSLFPHVKWHSTLSTCNFRDSVFFFFFRTGFFVYSGSFMVPCEFCFVLFCFVLFCFPIYVNNSVVIWGRDCNKPVDSFW